jgi:hypothetical protein
VAERSRYEFGIEVINDHHGIRSGDRDESEADISKT